MKLVVALATLTVMGLLSAVLLRAWPWINVVETGRTPQYPDLLPRTYRHVPEEIFDAALHALARSPRWTLVASRPESGEIHAEARTRLLRFVDDVQISIRAGRAERGMEDAHGTVVGIRSASRLGSADFGQNARNVREFFAALDQQLAHANRH